MVQWIAQKSSFFSRKISISGLLNILNTLFFGHQALYTQAPAYSLVELPSHARVRLNHSVEGVLHSSACARYV